MMRALKLLLAALLAAGSALMALPACAEQVPHAAAKYRSELVRNARMVWGMDAPVAAEAAQVQQESGWNANAHSSVAAGLTEFTPATATWISGAYPSVGPAQPYNPSWALRALTTYDYDLWQKTQPPQDPAQPAGACDHMAFALSAYNGGIGWVYKDQALAKAFKVYPGRWWGSVELFTRRSAAAMKENRGYPRRILLTLQPLYLTWGPGVDCSGVKT